MLLDYIMIGVLLILLLEVGYGADCNSPSPSNSTTIGLAYCPNAQVYVTTMLVGTPAQPIQLLLDISQPMIAITMSQCAGSCPQQTFDSQTSSTFNESGSVQGQVIEVQPNVFSFVGTALGSESVSMPPVFNTTTKSTISWILEAVAGPTSLSMPYGGIFGLGMPTYVGSRYQTNYLSNRLTNYTFSVQLTSSNTVLHIQDIPEVII